MYVWFDDMMYWWEKCMVWWYEQRSYDVLNKVIFVICIGVECMFIVCLHAMFWMAVGHCWTWVIMVTLVVLVIICYVRMVSSNYSNCRNRKIITGQQHKSYFKKNIFLEKESSP